jgi:hypothetical protein
VKEIDHLEDLDIDGRTQLKIDLKQLGMRSMELIYLAQKRDKWRILENIVTFGFHIMLSIS